MKYVFQACARAAICIAVMYQSRPQKVVISITAASNFSL
jgi:hypothetical protein